MTSEIERGLRDIESHVQEQDILDQAWIWHLPANRVESFALGPAALGLVTLVVAAVLQPAWPWWVSILAALTVVGPMCMIAVGMAVRAPWTGAGPVAAFAATPPAVAWIAAASATHVGDTATWVQWTMLGAYAALSVVTVLWWSRWTDRTRSVRRRIRWLREDAS